MKNPILNRNFVFLSVVSLLFGVACSEEESVAPIMPIQDISVIKFSNSAHARNAILPSEMKSTAAFCTYRGCDTTFGPNSFWVPLEAVVTFATPLPEEELDLSRPPFEYYNKASVEWLIKGENDNDFQSVSTDQTGSVERGGSIGQPGGTGEERTQVVYRGSLFLQNVDLALGTYEVVAQYTMDEQVVLTDRSEIQIVAD